MPTIEVLQTIETKRQKMQSSSPHYRIHTALEAVIPGKPTTARSIILHVCADENALEEPRATCMRGGMVGYIKPRADTKEYLRLAPRSEFVASMQNPWVHANVLKFLWFE